MFSVPATNMIRIYNKTTGTPNSVYFMNTLMKVNLSLYIIDDMLYCKQTYTMHGFFASYSQELPRTGDPQEARFGSVSSAAVAVSTAALLVSQARKEQRYGTGG